MGVKTTIRTTYIIEQSEEGKKLAEELKDRKERKSFKRIKRVDDGEQIRIGE